MSENNENNENKENKMPEENSASEQSGDEDIKAFKFEWEGDGNMSDTSPTDDASSANSEKGSDGDSTDESMSESGNSSNGEPCNDSNGESAGAHDETLKDKTDAAPGKKPRRDRALPISCILSACSVILLVVFAASLMLGIFPIKGKEVVFIGVSDSGATNTDADASPELIEDFLNSVVVVTARTASGISTGTGVILSDNGYIITNYHVVEGSETIAVQLYNEDMALNAEVVGFHEKDDVAVIKVNRTDLRAATFAKSSDVRYGEKIYAVGTPEGAEFRWSVTQGIVSCPSRELYEYNSDGTLEYKINVVQIDALVNHGNSGGPVINARGEVVGIVTLKKIWSQQSDSSGNREPVEGMGFALPSNGVLIDAAAIIEEGNADNVDSGIILPRPLVGITGVGVTADTYYKNVVTNGQSGIEKVDEEYAKANPSSTFYAAVSGVHVSAVSQGSDAAKYLREGDIVTEFNGSPVSSIYDVMNIINQYNKGDKVTVKYYRDGKHYTAELTLRSSEDLD